MNKKNIFYKYTIPLLRNKKIHPNKNGGRSYSCSFLRPNIATYKQPPLIIVCRVKFLCWTSGIELS